MSTMFRKVLVANRGEIACRVIRTAKKLGVKTVAVYSEPDESALHVRTADEAYCIGPAASDKSYLNMRAILDVARESGAQAIHPGYGFLSENAEFARLCEKEGVVFIGPPPSAIEDMGRKDLSKQIMSAAGVPVIEGYDQQDQSCLHSEARRIGYPIMLKAVKGGGGRGMRIVKNDEEFELMLKQAQAEALAGFNDDRMILEKFVEMPRHVEVQVFADQHGNTVYLYERDCSVQRRHQKIIEESPAPGLTDEIRHEIGQAAVQAAKAVGYVGAGTVEFLMDSKQKFYFMEMNTRLQVEHPVTEMVTGTDLVEWQLKVAAGEKLALSQADIRLHGHAFEARVYAEKTEDTPTGPAFIPSSGGLLHYLSPPETSEDVRLETGFVEGDEVVSFYDPMIAKLIVWAPERRLALQKLRQSLANYHIVGPSTNIGFLGRLAGHPAFVNGDVHTDFIPMQGRSLCSESQQMPADTVSLAAFFMILLRKKWDPETPDSYSPFQAPSASRINSESRQYVRITDGDELISVEATAADDGGFGLQIERRKQPAPRPSNKMKKKKQDAAKAAPPVHQVGTRHVSGTISPAGENSWLLICRVDGRQFRLTAVMHGDTLHLFSDSGSVQVPFYKPRFVSGINSLALNPNAVFSPMTGKVEKVMCEPGDSVKKDDPLVIVEAMKTKMVLRSPRDGIVEKVSTSEGSQVSEKSALVTLVDEDDDDEVD